MWTSQAISFFYGPEAYFQYHTRGVKSGDVMKAPSMKMYLAGWNHYPEGQIRNALYLHLIQDSDSMVLHQPVTDAVLTLTDEPISCVSQSYTSGHYDLTACSKLA
jgi:hypothetical protein